MKGYGQFCPLAIASEIVAERWTPLVLRELMIGRHRFNDIMRGVPRMSPALLAHRLKTLERAGIVKRRLAGGRIEYSLSAAGSALVPVVEGLAAWGKTWLPATLSRDNTDPDLLMWDIHRRIDLAKLPPERTVLRFEFADQPRQKRYRWIVGENGAVQLCITDPGYEVDLYVSTSSRIMIMYLVWYGDIPLRRALADRSILVDGPRRLCTAFPSWLMLNELAGIPRRQPLEAA